MQLSKLAVILFIFLNLSINAQNKTFTLEEVTINARIKFAVQNLAELQWLNDSEQICYVDSLNGQQTLFRENIISGTKEILITLDSLNALLGQADFKPLKRFPKVKATAETTLTFWNDHELYQLNIQTMTVKLINKLEKDAQNIEPEENHGYAAYTIKNNLFIAFNSETIKQITFDKDEGLVNGQTVHRVEFGINQGSFWSPRGNYLAYYHKNESMVTQYPLIDIASTPAQLVTTRYPMAGQTSEQVQVGIYNLKTGSTTFLQTGEPKDQYITSVVWSPDEKHIYLAHLNREQIQLRMVKYDPYSGLPVQTIFEEFHPKYINPQRGLIFINNNPNEFVWLSQRDGFNHLYLYNSDGQLIRQLTRGNWEITEFKGFDSKGAHAFFTGASEDALERHGYRINLNSGKLHKLTSAPGQHDIEPNKKGSLFIDRFSNLETPRKIAVSDVNGSELKLLLEARNPLADYKMGKITLNKISQGGFGLNTRLIYPCDFDPQKRYPAIIYVYGGPGVQEIHNRWLGGAQPWDFYLSQKGYFIFSLDNRGSANRGREFEQQTFRKLGTIEVEDQKAGLQYLKSLDFIDSTRIGVFGWSYGGFMTISMMTRLPGQFRAAVSGAPVTDWKYYEVMYGERYMDTPQSNPEGYAESSTLNYIDNLQGNLLIIHGTADPTVVWQNTLTYIDKAIKLGKHVDYAVYPGQEHGIRGKSNLHLYQKITDYFNRYLEQ